MRRGRTAMLVEMRALPELTTKNRPVANRALVQFASYNYSVGDLRFGFVHVRVRLYGFVHVYYVHVMRF